MPLLLDTVLLSIIIPVVNGFTIIQSADQWIEDLREEEIKPVELNFSVMQTTDNFPITIFLTASCENTDLCTVVDSYRNFTFDRHNEVVLQQFEILGVFLGRTKLIFDIDNTKQVNFLFVYKRLRCTSLFL